MTLIQYITVLSLILSAIFIVIAPIIGLSLLLTTLIVFIINDTISELNEQKEQQELYKQLSL